MTSIEAVLAMADADSAGEPPLTQDQADAVASILAAVPATPERAA